jgi:hypothetical protein
VTKRRNKEEIDAEGRGRDILEIFVELSGLARDEEDEQSLWPSIYHPPWREAVGKALGPWFGPRTPGAYTAEVQAYRESIYGGGLWCEGDRQAEVSARAIGSKRQFDFRHLEIVHAFMRINSANVPDMELEIYFGIYRDGLGISEMATRLGKSRNVVDQVLFRFRNRVEQWAEKKNGND